MTTTTALILAVLSASVLGSFHCAGMCGAFLAIALSDADKPSSRWRLQTMYHGGRLITYTLLGTIAGSTGSLLDMAGSLTGLQKIAMPLAGLSLALFGLVTLLRHHGWTRARLKPPGFLVKIVSLGQTAAMRFTPTRRALIIGLLTTLLPCGWLYAFAVTAAGTAHPVTGGMVMAVFWLGTLPVMVSLGAGFQGLLGPIGKRVPTLTCIVLIAMGIFTLTGRWRIDPTQLATANAQQTNPDQTTVNQQPIVPSTAHCPACHSDAGHDDVH